MQPSSIGETIARARKTRKITQEQLGRMVGVSSGAVSKWETGSAAPDIALLAPLARALDITLDTLLSFNREIPQETLVALTASILEAFNTKGVEAGRAELYEALRVYPNSDRLKMLGAHCIGTAAKQEKTEALLQEAFGLYSEATESEDALVRQAALAGMAEIYILQGEEDNGQTCLKRLAAETEEQNYLPLFAGLLIQQGKFEKAERLCKQQLHQAVTLTISVLSQLAVIAEKEGRDGPATQYLETRHMLEKTFAPGFYLAANRLAEFYLVRGELDRAAEWFERFVDEVLALSPTFTGNLFFEGLEPKREAPVEDNGWLDVLKALLENEAYQKMKECPHFISAKHKVESALGKMAKTTSGKEDG